MASLGHVAVGMAAARFHNPPSPSGLRRASQRPSWSSMAAWSALSMLPDVDVIGFLNGVPYEAPWGHRGATHSFTFAIVVGLVVGLVARRLKQPALRTALFATAVVATHPLLDTLTDGGLGAALFWPFDLTRYFAPWRPIQVAPIGLDFFTPYGLIVALSETVLFLPLFAFALRRTGSGVRDSGFALAGWLVASWLVASSDPWRDATVAFLLRDRTEYASGFSESKFASLVEGQFKPHVREALGAPLEEGWMYALEGQNPRDLPANQPNACAAVRLRNDRVFETFGGACESRGIRAGQSKAEVERLLGTPSDSCWDYSRGQPHRPFRLRLVCFHGDAVEMIARRWVF